MTDSPTPAGTGGEAEKGPVSVPQDAPEPAPSPRATPEPAPGPAVARGPEEARKRTRTSTTYVGVVVGLIVLALVLTFIIQNLHTANVHFLTFNFHIAQGVIILASAVAGGVTVVLVSVARVAQLRVIARRDRRAHHRG